MRPPCRQRTVACCVFGRRTARTGRGSSAKRTFAPCRQKARAITPSSAFGSLDEGNPVLEHPVAATRAFLADEQHEVRGDHALLLYSGDFFVSPLTRRCRIPTFARTTSQRAVRDPAAL